jgi:essential nuclear protein 1
MLTFAQRYKQDITAAQKEAFKQLLKTHVHHAITPQVRRELFSSKSRGEKDAMQD